MAEIDRVYTVEATGITPTKDSDTFIHNKRYPYKGCGTLPQLEAPTHRQQYPHTASGTFIQVMAPSKQGSAPFLRQQLLYKR